MLLFELFEELYMYEDDLNVIEIIADTFEKWCIANKYFSFKYEILDYRKKFCINDIIIIHNLWKEGYEDYTLANGYRFLKDIEYILKEYCHDDDSYQYCYNFWIDELNGLLND